MSRADRFLKACRRQPVDATPIWLMRQAGRFMAEYRELRAKYTLLEMIKDPAIACEVTLQPVNAFEIDAAIIFADILPLLECIGMHLEFVSGQGPILNAPLDSPAAIERLEVRSVEQTLDYTIRAITLARQALNGRVPLIGFSGAPFTLACYAFEGRSSKEFMKARRFMYAQPRAWHHLMELLATAIGDYLSAQIRAGAQAVQLFDSWAGSLSPYDYGEYVLPHSKAIIDRVKSEHDVPFIHFGTGTSSFLPAMAQPGVDVVGVDWRTDLDRAWKDVGDRFAVQGNLDPMVLLGPVEQVRTQADRILQSVAGRNGHIFNLGHGVLKETPVETVKALVDHVHLHSARTAIGS